MGAVLFAMSFTSIVSAYLIKYNHQIFLVTERLLHRAGILKVRKAIGDENSPEKGRAITILGYHRGAQALIEFISHTAGPNCLKDLMVIDYQPRELCANFSAQKYCTLLRRLCSHADTLLHAGVAEYAHHRVFDTRPAAQGYIEPEDRHRCAGKLNSTCIHYCQRGHLTQQVINELRQCRCK
jgi:hypothetical protein